MSIVTRGFVEGRIITRGYYGIITVIVRDIARITSKVILSATVISRAILSATVTSKLDLEEDDV